MTVPSSPAPAPLIVAGSAGARADRPAPPRSGWVARYGQGRVCSSNYCTTRLSVYNADLFCWMHQRPTPQPGSALRS